MFVDEFNDIILEALPEDWILLQRKRVKQIKRPGLVRPTPPNTPLHRLDLKDNAICAVQRNMSKGLLRNASLLCTNGLSKCRYRRHAKCTVSIASLLIPCARVGPSTTNNFHDLAHTITFNNCPKTHTPMCYTQPSYTCIRARSTLHSAVQSAKSARHSHVLFGNDRGKRSEERSPLFINVVKHSKRMTMYTTEPSAG
ncbi:hypothetical protein BDR06DRAFT_636825 [Suillus hirtellus]|nr:hypothetical protein BDR06DRAFT_636825 [Suillus hirtellus]